MNFEFYSNYFAGKKLAKKLEELKYEYKNKTVIIYGAGIIFEVLLEKDVLSSINIVAVADKKFLMGKETFYKGFKGINPNDIKKYQPDIIIICVLKEKEVMGLLKEDIYNEYDCPQIISLFSVFDTFFDKIKENEYTCPNFSEEIKLVIWDLDETFWKGTLSEEKIEAVKENIEIVKTLTNRGIINSIASKNTFEDAKKELEKHNIWDYFIFPTISWDFKHKMVDEIIQKTKLRPINILFIDDNHLNIEEIKHYFPGINVASPEFLHEILSNKAFHGKNDEKCSRLNQYKILEQKETVKNNFSDNKSFLMSCNIKIQIMNVENKNAERVFELINRANQLNFTKIRFAAKEDFDKILKNQNYENKCVSASDRFGNYGIIGFYCYDKDSKELLHYVFSCRVLNLKIEQYVYALLGFPNIKTSRDTAEKLNDFEKPEWINLVKDNIDLYEGTEKNEKALGAKLFIQGGCDIELMLHFFNDAKEYSFIENFARNSLTNHVLRNDHIQCLKNAKNLDVNTLQRLVDKLPFIEMSMFKQDIFEQNYDVLIFSVLMDYTQYLCVENSSKIKINIYKTYWWNFSENKDKEKIESFKKNNIYDIDEKFLNTFRKEFSLLDRISVEEFKENLKWLRENISKPIVFINAAEIEGFTANSEPDVFQRHRLFNNALDEFVNNNSNTYLLDMRKFVKTREDCADHIRHYQFYIYKEMAEELKIILKKVLNLN